MLVNTLNKIGAQQGWEQPATNTSSVADSSADEFVLASVNLGQKFQVFEPFNKRLSTIYSPTCRDVSNQDSPSNYNTAPRANTILAPGAC